MVPNLLMPLPAMEREALCPLPLNLSWLVIASTNGVWAKCCCVTPETGSEKGPEASSWNSLGILALWHAPCLGAQPPHATWRDPSRHSGWQPQLSPDFHPPPIRHQMNKGRCLSHSTFPSWVGQRQGLPAMRWPTEFMTRTTGLLFYANTVWGDLLLSNKSFKH